MRSLILGVAVACYATALAIAGAGMRLPEPQPAAIAEIAPERVSVGSAPASEPASVPLPAPPADALPQAPAGQMATAVAVLAREQAASREMVTELQSTVALLQRELAGQRAARQADGQLGHLVASLGGPMLPPGQATLGPGVEKAVRAALPDIMADPARIVSVEGHTDGRPIRTAAGKSFRDNADLSLLRARAVAALVQKHGVAAARIQVKGWGDTRPLATNDTAEGRERNRRVEIRLLPPAASEP